MYTDPHGFTYLQTTLIHACCLVTSNIHSHTQAHTQAPSDTHIHTHTHTHTQAIGSVSLAYQCFKLSLTTNNSHAEAYNNLGVIEWRRGRGEQVRNTLCVCVCVCVGEKGVGGREGGREAMLSLKTTKEIDGFIPSGCLYMQLNGEGGKGEVREGERERETEREGERERERGRGTERERECACVCV